MFKTTDAGEHWETIMDAGQNGVFPVVAIDPVTPTTLYAVASLSGLAFDACSYVSFPKPCSASSTVFKSVDGGVHRAAVPVGEGLVNTLAIDPLVPATLYAGTSGGGVLKSIDGGMHWGAINTGLTDLAVNTLAIDPTWNTVYAGTYHGLFDLWPRELPVCG